MRILTEFEASQLLGTSDLCSFFEGADWHYPEPVPNYRLPKDSGEKVVLARVISNALVNLGPFVLWITETGVWPTAEHLDLFDRYRLSFGERRSLHEAPVHVLEQADRNAAISLISLGLFFVWGFEIVACDRSIAVTVSHDEWMEVRHSDGHDRPAFELANSLAGWRH